MKDETIRPGDLVYVAKPTPCCGNTEGLGKVFTAGDIASNGRPCFYCGKRYIAKVIGIPNSNFCIDVRRLRKIDPPATGEYDRVPVRMREPA